jgi:rhodanese-related sulfurtransferase
MMHRGRSIDVVLDVRSTLERLFGRVSGSAHLPMSRLEQDLPRLAGIDRSSVILVHCASGIRSARAVAIMHRMGYVNAIDGGGMAAVRRELQRDHP